MSNKEEQYRVSALNFTEIKDSLKEYLQGQDQFSDYNFEGSAMNILLDVLAYNTHYSGFYNNMAASEMFLDSANLRSSAVSIAKHLGYSPRSKTSAFATIKLSKDYTSETAHNNPSITISAYSKFKTSFNGTNYNFSNLKDILAYPSVYNSESDILKYETEEFLIYEGAVKTTSFIYDGIIKEQRFTIENVDIDTSTIQVYIKGNLDSADGDKVLWTRSTNITELDSLSKKYTVEENADGFFEIYFGDGVIGEKLQDGNIIEVTYLVSNGELLNGSGKTFTNITNGFTVEVVEIAVGGGERESLESIKFTAPKTYATQERAVTIEDYKALVLRDFPVVDAVSVWGGEENDPPAYGKVFLSIKPKQGTKLSTPEKLAIIRNITVNRNVVGITPEIIDPAILYILVDVEAWWHSNKSSYTRGELLSTLQEGVLDYRTTYLTGLGFDGMFYEVDLISKLKELDSSITAVILKTKIQKRLTLSELGVQGTKIYFTEKLFHPHDGHKSILTTNNFYHRDVNSVLFKNCELYDNGEGNVGIQYLDGTSYKYFTFWVGSIDYITGILTLNKKFKPISVVNNLDLRFTAKPDSNNFCPNKELLLEIDTLDVDSIKVKLGES